MSSYIDEVDFEYRLLAYIGTFLILSATNLLGGTWVGFSIGIIIMAIVNWLFPGSVSKSNYFNRWLSAVLMLRNLPLLIQVLSTLSMVALTVVIDLDFGPLIIGRAIKVFVVPIFLVSLLHGWLAAHLALVFGTIAMCYLEIPPRFSFAIDSIQGLWHLLSFAAIGMCTILIGHLIIRSSVLHLAERKHRVEGRQGHD